MHINKLTIISKFSFLNLLAYSCFIQSGHVKDDFSVTVEY